MSRNVHPPAFQDVQQYKRRQKQDHEDFSAVQIQEADSEGAPGDSAERQSGDEAARCPGVGRRAEADFFRDMVGEECKKEQREARPLCGRDPSFVDGQLQPRAKQEKQDERADGRAEQSGFPARKLFAQGFPMKRNEHDPGEAEKGCKVIALVKTDRAQGIPEMQQGNDERGGDGKFEEESAPGDGIAGLHFR